MTVFGAGGLSVLSAMIVPAVLISACGTLILSTSNRLGRAVDRIRTLTTRYRELGGPAATDTLAQEERALIFRLVPRIARRVRLLQQALTAFYLAVGLFVLTSVVIGGSALWESPLTGLELLLGLGGAVVLSYGSGLLIIEAQLALQTSMKEMKFLIRLGQQGFPEPPPAEQNTSQQGRRQRRGRWWKRRR